MNQRINKLAQQAADSCPSGFVEIKDFIIPYTEKLAELIVRECIKSTLSLQDTAIDNEWGTDETFHMIVDTIAEDFDMQHIFRS